MEFLVNYILKLTLVSTNEGSISIYIRKVDSSLELSESIIIKKRILCVLEKLDVGCLFREYKVGMKLNTINHINLMKTYAYFCDKDNAYLVIEHVKGDEYTTEYFTRNEISFIMRHLILILDDIQSKIKFTHYDLHIHNIIVHKNPAEKELYYNSGKIVSPYDIKIIDFGGSYVEKVEGWTEIASNSVICGVCSGVYDNVYDFITIFEIYRFLFSIDDVFIEAILTRNGFIPYQNSVGKNDFPGKHGFSKFIGREYWEDFISNMFYEDSYKPPYYSSIVDSKFDNIDSDKNLMINKIIFASEVYRRKIMGMKKRDKNFRNTIVSYMMRYDYVFK